MSDFFNNKIRLLFALFFLISVLPFLINLSTKTFSQKLKNELFRSELSNLNSTSKAVNYIDSTYDSSNLTTFDTLRYVEIVSQFVKEKFHFGLSNYTISENWIAYLSGKVFWSHLSAIVNPDDILKHSEGLCSQQTIVFMELLKRKGIIVRSVGLGYPAGPGHFLSEVQFNNSWHLYDVTMEPVWYDLNNSHKSMAYYLNNKDSLFMSYENVYSKPIFNKLLEQVVYGKTDVFPAKNMKLFHQITLILTYILPILFLLGLYLNIKRHSKNRTKV